jgi:hypothetical protein
MHRSSGADLMTVTASQPAKPRLVWQIALTLSLMGWILTAGRIAVYFAGNGPRQFDWHSVGIDSVLLLISTALSLRGLRRAR